MRQITQQVEQVSLADANKMKQLKDSRNKRDSAALIVRAHKIRQQLATRTTVRNEHRKGQIMTTEEKTKPFADLFEQTTKNYEQAVKAGLKVQEESVKAWAALCNQTSSPPDIQKRAKAVAEEIVGRTQTIIGDYVKATDQYSRSSVELLKKALAVTQAGSVQDAQSKVLAFWEATLGGVRETAQAVTQAHSKAFESWVDFVRKATEPVQTGPTQSKT